MAARRPKAQSLPSEEKIGEIMKAAPIIEEAKASFEVSGTASRGIPYQSVRTVRPSGARQAHPNLVEASREQTIEFLNAPYPHFRIMPGGTEIPLQNVAGAVPFTSEIAKKASRAERLAKRAANLSEKMGTASAGERAAAPAKAPKKSAPKVQNGIQEVAEEDDDLDESLDDDPVDGEGEETDDVG